MRLAIFIGFNFWLMSGTVFGQRTPALAPDEIFYNGKIVTVDPAFSIQQAFAIKADEFLAVGKNAEVRALAGPKTRLTDLRGHTVTPGLMDNHNHQYNAALRQFRGVDLAGVPSLAEMLSRVRQAVGKAKPGEIVFTTASWVETDLPEKRGPTRQELDGISSDHPIVVYPVGGRAYLNTAAFKAARIPIPQDDGRQPASIIATPVTKIIPLPTHDDQKELIRKMQDQQHAMGLTSIREWGITPDIMRAYWSLRREGQLTMRVNMALELTDEQKEQVEGALKPWGVSTGFGDHQLRLDGIAKLSVEGTPDNAYLREPRLDLPNDIGKLPVAPEQFRGAIFTMQQYGWRPDPNINGDRALDIVLDAFEAANAREPIREKRWMVEHIPLVHADQMERMARLGVLISAQIQPYEAGLRGADNMIRTLGKERAERSLPIRELLDHKLIVGAGSDWPISTNNPFVVMYFYVTRKTANGGVSGASQRITREEALRLSTVNNAYMTFEEKEKGSIERDKLADFLILSDDILTIPEDQIRSVQPLATYVGGRKVFSRRDGGF